MSPDEADDLQTRPGAGLTRDGGVPTGAWGPASGTVGALVGPADDPERFELVELVDRGGEGYLWRARRSGARGSEVQVDYAIKELHPAQSGASASPAAGDVDATHFVAGYVAPAVPPEDEGARLRDSALVLRELRSEHMVTVHEIFDAPGVGHEGPHALFVVMEWVPGATLVASLGGFSATVSTLAGRLQLIDDIAQGLNALHSGGGRPGGGLVHRDLKPANVIVHPGRGAVLVDVSTARAGSAGDPVGMHSLAYSAPEVLGNPWAARSPASDVYGFGAVAAFVLLGADPGDPRELRRDLVTLGRELSLVDPVALALHLLAPLVDDPKARPHDLAEWVRILRALCTPASDLTSAPGRTPNDRLAVELRRARLTLAVTAVVLAFAALLIGFDLVRNLTPVHLP